MQKNLYFLICFIISFAFFIPAVNAIDDGPIPPLDGGPIPPIDSGPIMDNGPPSTIDQSASGFNTNGDISSQSSIEESTPVEMQKTGLPLTLIILSVLLVFGGFIRFKRK